MNNNKSLSKMNPFFRGDTIQKLISKCPSCNFQFKTLKLKIIEESEESQLVYIRCQKCKSSTLVLILNNGPLVSSMGIVTDLSEEDVVKFKTYDSLKEEDVLNLHQGLKSKNFLLSFKNNYNLWKKDRI